MAQTDHPVFKMTIYFIIQNRTPLRVKGSFISNYAGTTGITGIVLVVLGHMTILPIVKFSVNNPIHSLRISNQLFSLPIYEQGAKHYKDLMKAFNLKDRDQKK